MDKTNDTTEHRKGQHLTSEERHIIEVRWNKDKRSIYGIAKELGRPYNTVKNEIMRGTVLLYNGKVRRYKADIGYSVYLEHRQECRRKYRCLETAAFLQYVTKHFRKDKWSLDACACRAIADGTFQREKTVCTKTLYRYVELGLLPISRGWKRKVLAYTSRIPIHPVKKGRWNVIIGCCDDLFRKAKALMTTLRMKS